MSERKEKFTPGPWVEGWNGGLTGPRCAFTVFLDGQGRRLDYRVVSGQDMRLVCIIPDGEHAEGNEGNDAALIAAAPDMYAALEELLDNDGVSIFSSAIESDCMLGGGFDLKEWEVRARAALAKARGES